MMDTDRRFMLYLLSHAGNIGAVTLMKLTKTFNDLSDLLYMRPEDIKQMSGMSDKQIADLIAARISLELIKNQYIRLLESDIKYLTYFDKEYPEKLRNIANPPMTLFIKGDIPDSLKPSVAIVGARAATNYGKSMADFLAGTLAKEGVSIISGMALGIDGAAHRGAIKAGGSTFGILAGGVNICYPKDNFDCYDAMSRMKDCGILSESLPGTGNMKQNFPIRNRIISGLSDIVVTVEAREKSGSLITAEIAANQGREVMAVPGRVTDPMSRGCNKLIADGAGIVTCPDDVLEAIGIIKEGRIEIPDKKLTLLAKEEKLVYCTLDSAPKYTQDIVNETNLPYSKVCSILLELELKGLIEQISGNYYGII